MAVIQYKVTGANAVWGNSLNWFSASFTSGDTSSTPNNLVSLKDWRPIENYAFAYDAESEQYDYGRTLVYKSGDSDTIRISGSASYPNHEFLSLSVKIGDTRSNTECELKAYAIKDVFIYQNFEGSSGKFHALSLFPGQEGRIPKIESDRDGYSIVGFSRTEGGEVEFSEGDVIANGYEDDYSPLYLFAVWKRVAFDVQITNGNTAAGVLALVDSSNRVVANESRGVLSYSGKAGVVYGIECKVLDELYTPLGVKGYDGNYFTLFKPFEGASISLTYEFKKKDTYSISLEFDGGNGSVSVDTPKAETVDGVDRWLGGEVHVSISPKTEDGWLFKFANVVDSEGILRGDSYTRLEDGRISIPLDFDITVRVGFEKARYTYGSDIDEHSMGVAITNVSASAEEEDPDDGTVEHGSIVTYSAVVAEGYLFAGWYGEDGLVSVDNPYRHVMTGNVVLKAKAKVSVSLSASTDEDDGTKAPPTLSVNGEVCDGNSYSGEVVLGESLSYSLSRGAWFFDSWYSGDDPISLPLEDTIRPTANMSLVARFTAEKVKRTLKVMTIRTSDGTPVFDSGLISSSVAPSPNLGPGLNDVPPPGSYVFEFDGTQHVNVRAAAMAGELAFNFFAADLIDGSRPDLDSVLSRESDYTFMLNRNVTIYACYGEIGKVKTTFSFANGSDRTMGEISVDTDDAKPGVDGSVTVDVLQQTRIVVSVIAKNGYVFVGWYSDGSGIGDPIGTNAVSEFTVTSQRTIYAKFRKNRHAVYEWEGSAENKMMEWRSKVYAAPVPFNPSAARVDARGYGVGLEVGMYSSPDGDPTRKAEITVKSQDARRLPTLRPERYMQVCVKNDAEVDAVIVGTSMKGLAV